MRAWGDLRNRWCQLDTQLNKLAESHSEWTSSTSVGCEAEKVAYAEAEKVAYAEANACREWIGGELESGLTLGHRHGVYKRAELTTSS